MRWFFKWLHAGLLREDNYDEPDYSTQGTAIASNRSGFKRARMVQQDQHTGVSLNQSAMLFKLYPATGGHIVEYSYYDEKKDSNTQALHLIHSHQDLGEALSQIMTLEALKR